MVGMNFFAEQNHSSERGRAMSVANADALGRPRRSVLPLGATNMKKDVVPKPKPNGPLGVRGSVWLMLLGGLLACLVLIKMSVHHTQPVPQAPPSEADHAVRRDPLRAPGAQLPVHELAQPLSPELNPNQTSIQQMQERLQQKRDTETNGIADPAEQQVLERLRQRREREATNRTLDPAAQQVLDRLQQKRETETNSSGR